MTSKRIIYKTLALVVVATSTQAVANEATWSVGAMAAFSPQPYKDTDTETLVVPSFGYDSDHFYVKGLTAGARLAPKESTHNLIFSLTYDPRRFDPDDSDDPQLKLLDKRDASVVAALAYRYRSPYGNLTALVGEGVTKDRDGLYGEVSWGYEFKQERWTITPNVGYSYNSSDLNQHLYGISASEAARSGLDKFDADSAGQYFMGLNGYFMITGNIQVIGGIRYSNLDDEISDSPMVDQSTVTTGYLGINYIF